MDAIKKIHSFAHDGLCGDERAALERIIDAADDAMMEGIEILRSVAATSKQKVEQDPYALDHRARYAVRAMLNLVAEETRPCRRCGRQIWMVRMKATKKLAPFTDDAVSHFADCPHAKEFKKGGAR
jgi:DNA polymerase III delta prime subunit